MKKFLTRMAIILVTLILIACGPTAPPPTPTAEPPPEPTAAEAETTAGSDTNQLVMSSGEWPPFTSASMDEYGLVSEIVDATVREMGMEPVYQWYPWRRTYTAPLEEGVWASFPWSINPDRQAEMHYSDELLPSPPTVFFYYGEPPIDEINTPEDLEGLMLGGILGYFYETQFEEAGLEYELASDTQQNFEKLMRGRIDLFPEVGPVGRYDLELYFPEEADNFGTLYFPWPVEDNEVSGLRLLVPKDDPAALAQLEAFNIALNVIKQDGTYDRLLEKYDVSFIDE